MRNRRISRRSFLAGGAAAGAAMALGRPFSIGKARAQSSGRVIMLGFDGAEPSIVEEMMARGELPNLAKLRDSGTFSRLGSTIPPQSPVAWTSFATCKNPGGHNIYDFVRRDPAGRSGPVPQVGTGSLEPATLSPEGDVIEPPKAEAYRKGTPFWSVADEQGVRSRILNIPFAFPPDPLKNGRMLCALGVPDLRGTTSTFLLLTEGPATPEDTRLSGGQRMALNFDGSGETRLDVPGPRDKRYAFRDPKAYASVGLSMKVDRAARRGTANVDGMTVELAEGQWSEWAECNFVMSPKYAVRGITRFYPFSLGEEVRIYTACFQFHPDGPLVPFTNPTEYAAELHDRYGFFKTVGWTYDTHAMRQGAIDEDVFMGDVLATMEWRARLTLDELRQGDADLFLSAWTAPDRVGHMFWRYRDPSHPLYDAAGAEKYGKALETTYKVADDITGRVMAELKPEDTLFVLSDHGFETWRTGFSINNWLADNGYLKTSNLDAAVNTGFLMGIDWAGTKAYSVGLSSVYLNLQNRERGGSVPQDQADAVIAELRDKLLQVKDPATGKQVFSNIYTRADFHGEAIADAPDLSLGYAHAYQSSKQAAKGGLGTSLFEPNDDKWSGEHAASDLARLPGMFFSNKPVETDKPDILDLGVTALTLLGRDVPSDYEGKAIVS